jgi:hypothetical protein
MDVTHGQHKWWKGKEMRRLKARYKRHNYQNKSYKKTKLKAGCPVSVPAVLPPCPAKLTASRRGRRSYKKKGKFKKLDSSSSEEDDGWFARFRKPKKAARKALPKKCVDAKTRKTSSYYPGGTYSTKTITYSTRTVTYPSKPNFDREDTEDEEDKTDKEDNDSESSTTFEINTTPIIDIRNIDISASRTIYSETASTLSERGSVWSIQSSVSSPMASQTFTTAPSSATVGLNDLLNAGRRDSSLVMNEWPPAVSASSQWRSSIKDASTSTATAISPAESIAPTSTWKNSVASGLPPRGDSSSSGGSLDDIIRGNKDVKSLIMPSLSSEWSGTGNTLQIDALGSRSIAPSSAATTLSSSKNVEESRKVPNLDDMLRTKSSNDAPKSTWLPTLPAATVSEQSKTLPDIKTTPINIPSSGGSLDDIIKGNNNAKSSIKPSPSSEWSGSGNTLQIDELLRRSGDSSPKFDDKSILPYTKTTPLVENTQNRDATGKNAFTDQTILPTIVATKTTSISTSTSASTSTTTSPTTPTSSKPSTASEATTRRRWDAISNDKKETSGESEIDVPQSTKNSAASGSTEAIETLRTMQNGVTSALLSRESSLDEILRNPEKSSITTSSAATTLSSFKNVEETRKVPGLDDLWRTKSSNDNSNEDKNSSPKNTWLPFFPAVTVPEQSKPLPDVKTPPINLPRFDERNLFTNAVTFPNVYYTLDPDLFTKKSTEQTNIAQNPIANLPKFDPNNNFVNIRMTLPDFNLQTMNLDFLLKKVTEQTESPTMKTAPQIDPKLLWAQTKTTFTSSANIDFGKTINQKGLLPQVTEPPTTLTAAETTSTPETTLGSISRGRENLISNDKRETPETVADTTKQSTKAAQLNLNDLLTTGTTRTGLELQTTNKVSFADNTLQFTRPKNAEISYGTTKNSLLEFASAGQEKTINPSNQLYTTRNFPVDGILGTKEESLKNDKRTEEAKSSTIKEVVTENGRSSATYSAEPLSSPNNNKAKSEASSGPDSSQRPTGTPNLIDLIATSGPAVDNKRGEADEKTKSPLNDLLGAKSDQLGPNRKEITFSGTDKSVTSADTKYQPPPTKSESSNFHTAGADATPAKSAETINPPGFPNNRGNENTPAADKRGGSLNDLLATQKATAASEATRSPLSGADPAGVKPLTPAEAKEEDSHRKYVFYLMFGNPNCNCPGGAPPKVTVNRISPSANDTGDIKWAGGGGADSAGSLSDGEGGTFYIGFRKGPAGKAAGDKVIQPMIEIKMDKDEKACNSIYSSFFK